MKDFQCSNVVRIEGNLMIDSKITFMISSCRWKLNCYLDMLKICVYVNKFQTKHKIHGYVC